REVLRAVRLRRAALLEQRLGRIEDACEELESLLKASPENSGALRYLADLMERRHEHARAAALWRRAAAVETDPAERDGLDVKAGRAARLGGDLKAALEDANRVLSRRPARRSAMDLRIDVARALGADADLSQALETLADDAALDGSARGELLLESAQAAARAGDHTGALDRARRAAEAAPDRATPQLLARGLEYRLRGAGTPEEARATQQQLALIQEPLGPDDAALRAFLRAEALDVVPGPPAGLEELEAVRTRIGDHPLIALALAERFAAVGDQTAAVDAYRVALGGRLLDLRKPGSVALAAADAAMRANRSHEAAYFLDLAEHHEEARADARARRMLLIERETAAARPATVALTGRELELADLEAALRGASMPAERARARFALGKARLDHGDARGAEPLLWEALADGLSEAGDVLAGILGPGSDRARDLIRVRRQQVFLQPGHVGRLEALRAATLSDDDRVYARAVEHVLRAFDPGAGPLPAPPLASQPEQTGIFALLSRPSMDAAGEALALLWEGAMQLFVRDAASYAITGVERVVPGPSSPIARIYEASLRLLDVPRIPLFVPRLTPGMPTAHVALLSPPSVILTGDVREDTPELRYAFGRGLSAALPHNVLRMALPAPEGRALVEATRAAFGPPEFGRGVDPRAARLAEAFWQIIPARTQRRLQHLLGGGSLGEYEELLARANHCGRRVGLFLAGDFGCAGRALLSELGARFDAPPILGNLESLCQNVPALADLLRLAVSPEYANARWHSVAPASRRGNLSSGRFSLF
ncbi:MAG TPA: hypothetical protein VKU41_09650, partial [Polyangiaceae bacterium]|nr:hypothetical protein [Polyangiaceae bacterium]